MVRERHSGFVLASAVGRGGHDIRAVVMSSLESPLRLPEPQFVVWIHGQTT